MPETAIIDNCHRTLSNEEFSRLSSFIYRECGIKMPPAKRTMLEGRLQKRLKTLGMPSFRSYCDFLFSQEGLRNELVHMIDVVTTNKTDFFRESTHFDYLTQVVLPEWANKRRYSTQKLQVWSAGCSTGEEPYTLAMVLSEFAARTPAFDFQILATDISSRVLERAMTAIYEEERVVPVPAEMRRKYLLRSRDHSRQLVRIVQELRHKIRFRRLNFMDDDFGFSERMDIIFCRNVIIYFDRSTQEALLNKFHRQLSPGGLIFMGHSETLNGLDVPLELVHPTVYRKPA